MRLALPVAAAIWLAVAVPAPARAQQSAAPTPPVLESTRVDTARRTYEDRVMDIAQSKDEEDTAAAEYDPLGWPRGISLQLTRNFQSSRNASVSSDATRADTQGVQVDAYVETPNFGALSLHALALGGHSATGLTSWSLRQTGLPFDGGWRADNALGTTNLLLPDLAQRNGRLALPSTQVLGGSTIWRNQGSNSLVLGASVGEPGRFEGFPQSRFVGSGGHANSAFVQATTGEWTVAAAVGQGNNILPETASFNDAAGRVSPRGFYFSAAKNDLTTGVNWQASAIGSRTPGTDAVGVWGDAIWRDGGHRHQISIFHFGESLAWIDRPLPADLKGASYRYDYNSLRWDVSTNVESFASVSGKTPSGWYGSASARRLLSAAVSIGGGFAVRDFGVTSGSGFGYVQWQNSLGVSRLQLDAAAAQRGQRSEAVTFDHSVYAENGLSLSTTLSLETLQSSNSSAESPRPRENAAAFGLSGRIPLTNSLSMQGSFRARNVRGGVNAGTALAANLGVDWQISRDWSFGASFYENLGVLTETIVVQSPLVAPEIIRARPNDRGFFLTLRYSSRAGTPSIPLGGAPGSGSGSIEGSVFLDANGNGQRDGNESGAANVLVVLDGRFSVRTNALGSFGFPNVASGPHTLAVLQDDLPLPWTVDTEQKINAPVSTRDTFRIDIGAKRMR